ncbi:DUF2945 domain-containing protein [Streptomyces alkaliphilus]|uniref:DUF2945 domain-containing protein n=1 Tax=Streptomyces alkaliphilus TaxID=1472722 RepID=UPI00117C8C91|nr:DUF2945 domain-containing protein [Streptomyces alkaliphilus]MQS07568.1 DUF2945 domain-containing protein [Streptomyces alkaliphilus]
MGGRRKPRKGDRVAWSSHGGEAVGRVEEEITERTEAAGRTVDASPDDPQYRVRSEKSGGSAVHRPEALRPKPDRGSGADGDFEEKGD